VVLNFSAERPVFAPSGDLDFQGNELLVANYPVDAGEDIRRLSCGLTKRVSTACAKFRRTVFVFFEDQMINLK